MKRLITYICLIIVIVVGYVLITDGYNGKKVKIASYKNIEKKSDALTKKLAVYDKKNQEEYETTVTNLNSALKSYQDSKSKYEAIVEELAEVLNKEDEETEDGESVIEEVIYSDKEKYKVDFLLITMGDYGEREGVDVVYQLTTSSTTDPNSSTLNYFLADLNFTVTGEYMNVVNFISDLENNDKLGWEIRNFSMEAGSSNGYSGVTGTFTIKDVPIDSESYITSSSGSSVTDGTGSTDDTSTSSSNGTFDSNFSSSSTDSSSTPTSSYDQSSSSSGSMSSESSSDGSVY